jgi:hypothetical protein
MVEQQTSPRSPAVIKFQNSSDFEAEPGDYGGPTPTKKQRNIMRMRLILHQIEARRNYHSSTLKFEGEAQREIDKNQIILEAHLKK